MLENFNNAVQFLPEWFLSLQVIIFGLLIGSFTNVLVARFPWHEGGEKSKTKGRMSIVTPRSHCPKCKKMIAWYDNIPLFSFLALQGKCRSCKSKISWRYPVIEFLTALLYFAAYKRYGFNALLFLREFPFLTALVVMTFIDLEHRLIPDLFSIGGAFYGLALSFLLASAGRDLNWVDCLSGAAFGFFFFYGFSWIYWKMTGRIGLGGGDVKLLAMLGAFLGVQGVFHAILISSVVGSLVGILWGKLSRSDDIRHFAIPYGPFLVIGGLYYYLLGSLPWLQYTIPT